MDPTAASLFTSHSAHQPLVRNNTISGQLSFSYRFHFIACKQITFPWDTFLFESSSLRVIRVLRPTAHIHKPYSCNALSITGITLLSKATV